MVWKFFCILYWKIIMCLFWRVELGFVELRGVVDWIMLRCFRILY